MNSCPNTLRMLSPDLTRHATKLLDETHRPDPNWQVAPLKPKPSAPPAREGAAQ